MRDKRAISIGLAVVAGLVLNAGTAAAQALPLRNGRPALATVNGAAISLDEFLMQAEPGTDAARLRQGLGGTKEVELLDRLVTVKLIAQEAARMGLDAAPEIKKQVDVTSREILREVLFERILKDVKADPAVVDRLYKDAVREWKTMSLLFQAEAPAEAARKELAAGSAFKDVAAKAAAAKTAKADGDDLYHTSKEYFPQVVGAIAALQAGQVSAVVKIPAGFVVVKVVDVRYPDNPAARAEAQKQAASDRQQAAMKAHDEALRRNFVVVNKALLKSLDYQAPKPGIDALQKDKRVVAEIKGAAPVTVADLTEYLRLQFFHGSDQAAQLKKMNDKKGEALEATVGRRALNAEAVRLGIDRTSAYRDRVSGFRESLVFDSFVQKTVAPASKLREDEVRQYYNAHIKDYSSPEMLKVRSLAFTRRAAAEDAVRKLREGADYGWLATNAPGQVAKGAPGLLTFSGQPVMTSSMPDGLQRALAASKAKDLRLYASPEGHFYALSVQQVVAPEPKPYTQVRDEIAKKVYGEKLKKGVEDYAAKLRARSKVETFLKKVQ